MATKERHKVIPPGSHTDAGVKKYAATYGISESEARSYLIQYALNRLATLARYAGEKKPKASKPKASKPKASKPKASKPKASKPKASKPAKGGLLSSKAETAIKGVA